MPGPLAGTRRGRSAVTVARSSDGRHQRVKTAMASMVTKAGQQLVAGARVWAPILVGAGELKVKPGHGWVRRLSNLVIHSRIIVFAGGPFGLREVWARRAGKVARRTLAS